MAGRKKRDDGGNPEKAVKPPKSRKVRTKKVATSRDPQRRIIIDRDDHTPTPPMRQATIPSMPALDAFWSRPSRSDSATPTESRAVVPSATTPGSEATLPSRGSIPPSSSRPPRPVRNLTISFVLLFIFVKILDLTFLCYLADASSGRFC